jgi:hypothetical protein
MSAECPRSRPFLARPHTPVLKFPPCSILRGARRQIIPARMALPRLRTSAALNPRGTAAVSYKSRVLCRMHLLYLESELHSERRTRWHLSRFLWILRLKEGICVKYDLRRRALCDDGGGVDLNTTVRERDFEMESMVPPPRLYLAE